jgi:hypothetical protein
MRFRWRALLIGWLLLTLTLVFPPPAPTGAQTGNRVALVVRFDDETVVTRCITFSEAQISGYEVLDRSGLKIVADFSGMGAAICKIEDTGCSDSSNCFCKSPPDYWSYWHLDGEAWVYAQAGASGHQVSDGDVEGWSWGPAKPPPVIPVDEICTPPPTDTPTPTNTPTATPIPTLQPTSAPPTVTPKPSVQFWVDAETVAAGTCTTVHWITQQMQAVRLNGQDVPATGIRSVCPCASETYELQIIYPDGSEETLSLTVSAMGSCEAPDVTATPTLASPTVTPLPTSSPQPTGGPTMQPTATPFASSTPSATPSPLPTSTPSPLPTLTTAAPPTATATRTPLPTVMPFAAPHSRTPVPPSYVIFGVIAAGLLVGLFVFVRRQG